MPDLSVVVPVHNEATFLPSALPSLIEAVHEVSAGAEILVVENGSTDGTADVARDLGGDAVRVIELDRADKGEALRRGFAEATGEWVISVDVDYFSADFMRAVLASPADVVVGSKRDPASEDRRPLVRRFATVVFNLLLRLVLQSQVSDTHGMLGFRRWVLERHAHMTVSGTDLFDTELILRAERDGAKIAEVPVVVAELRDARSGLLGRVPRTLRGLVRIRRLLPPR
ncbi:MAG: glycosyltransferase [Acidimicrobiia bacterium]